jgi:hypothetical protein
MDRPPHFDDPQRGLTSELTLPRGKQLYHGSLAAEFTHEHSSRAGPSPYHYTHPPHPNAPAWFADNEKFALHAAVRFTTANQRSEIMLHSYTLYSDLLLWSVPNIEDFRIVMHEQFGVDAPVNGLAEGLVLAKEANAIDYRLGGYAMMEDMVRREPEYVLFDGGMRVLRYLGARTIRVEPITGTESKLYDMSGANVREVATYTYEEDGPGHLA